MIAWDENVSTDCRPDSFGGMGISVVYTGTCTDNTWTLPPEGFSSNVSSRSEYCHPNEIHKRIGGFGLIEFTSRLTYRNFCWSCLNNPSQNTLDCRIFKKKRTKRVIEFFIKIMRKRAYDAGLNRGRRRN